MEILRVTAKWTGFQGAPGYSAFHFAGGGGLITDAQQVADRVQTALNLLGPILPNLTQVLVQSEVERIQSETGEIVGSHSITPKAGNAGSATGAYSGVSGAVVNWRTSDYRGGRRIRGRTFVVPLGGSQYDASGTLATSALTALNAFATSMRSGDFDSEFGVWSRPVGGAGGVFATCSGHTVPDMAAVLRSRRD